MLFTIFRAWNVFTSKTRRRGLVVASPPATEDIGGKGRV
jgi:hypothetical protein